MPDKYRIIDSFMPLAKSKLWQLQRDYFDSQGINAWAKQVPFYVTSNPYIAKCYARTVLGFIRDTLVKNPNASAQPFYMIELGTGPGRFSFYMLKQLSQLQSQLGLTHIKFRYIMTDFTANNLQYWQQQPQLQPFVANGILDFAIYDMERDESIKLVNSKIELKVGDVKNPLIVFGNYIFDTVSSDCFFIANDKIKNCLISLSGPENKIVDGELTALDELKVEYKKGDLFQNDYSDERLNRVVENYRHKLKSAFVTIPSAGLRSLANLMKLSNDKLMLLSSDKGTTALYELENNQFPEMSFHGSFSIMVNFHAIAEFFKVSDGDAILQTPRKGIRSMVGFAGLSLNDLPETQLAINDYIEGLSPADYFRIHRRISDSYKESDASALAAHLQFAEWDAHVFQKIAPRLVELAQRMDRATLNYLARNMHKIADNFYFMPQTYDTFFDIGFFYQSIHQYDDAIRYYQQSAHYFGEKFGFLYNIGLCYYNLGDLKLSLDYLTRAHELDPEHAQAKQWFSFVSKEISA